jgi:hypothetical protein
MPKMIYNEFNDLDGWRAKETVKFFDTAGARSPALCVDCESGLNGIAKNFYISVT